MGKSPQAIDYKQRLLEEMEAYKRGGLKRFQSVREMADYIEAGIELAQHRRA